MTFGGFSCVRGDFLKREREARCGSGALFSMLAGTEDLNLVRVGSLVDDENFKRALLDELASHAQENLENPLYLYRIEGRAAHG